MDEFSYLSVMIAIILGLALTQVLKGFRGLLHARERVVMFWPVPVWAGLVMVIAVQSWWAMFDLRSFQDWNFLAFAVVLLQTIVIYMLAALVLPDFVGERKLDLRKSYFQQSRWFYGLLVLALLVSMTKELVLYGHLPQGLNLVFHLVFMAGGVCMALTRREAFHKVYTLFSVALFTAYIAVLFAHLR